MHYRIEADAELEDLEKVEKEEEELFRQGMEGTLKQRLAKSAKNIFFKKEDTQRNLSSNAVILHLDGDKRYTQKSQRYYNKLGLRAIVKNVPENKQPQVIGSLVRRYSPDIIVITRT